MSASLSACLSQQLETNIENHSKENRATENDIEGKGIDPYQCEAIFEDREHQSAKKCPHDCPRASLKRGSPNNSSRYSREHNLRTTCQGINRGDAKRFKDSGQTAKDG